MSWSERYTAHLEEARAADIVRCTGVCTVLYELLDKALDEAGDSSEPLEATSVMTCRAGKGMVHQIAAMLWKMLGRPENGKIDVWLKPDALRGYYTVRATVTEFKQSKC